MKTITKFIGVVFLIFISYTTFAQRTITGVVYNNGEPAAGIQVDGHKTNDSYYTSFDGAYKIEVTDKSKWIRFTFLDESKKLDIETNTSDVINFSWDGTEIPAEGDEPGVILKDKDQLVNDRDMDFMNNYSLYREFLKQGDFKSALPHWKVIYKTYPKSSSQIYIDGIKIMEGFMDKALSTDTKKAYLDTMMLIYDKRMKYLDNVGELLGRKAAQYLETILKLDLSDDELKKDIKKGYGFAEKSIELSGNKSEPAVFVLFMQSTKKLYSLDVFTQATVLDNYEKVMSIIEEQLKSDDTKDKANQALPLVETIIESSGALDCQAMVNLYSPKFKENPNDIASLKKMLKMFRKEDCDNELVVSISEKLYQLEPTAEAAYNMARTFLKKEEYSKAFEYYEKAYTNEENSEQKAKYCIEAAGLALQQSLLQKSRDLAKEAIKNKADYCEAYMLLGEIYAQASKSYSTNEFEKSTVFWLSVDYFNKAARYDNCKQDANNKANFYKNYFPNKEEVFFRSLNVGNDIVIGSWINETTKVSVKP